ncbi:MAG: polymer-forming cytoskeletal protein [Deltaproteobacteria bacterium]
MFGRQKGGKPSKSDVKPITTSIGEECIFEGNILTTSPTRIDGTLKGKISGDNSIIVGERGNVLGEIKALATIVFGKVEGIIESEKLEIKSTGTVTGDIFINTLIVEDGGTYNGRCAMEASIDNLMAKSNVNSSKEFPAGTINLEVKQK